MMKRIVIMIFALILTMLLGNSFIEAQYAIRASWTNPVTLTSLPGFSGLPCVAELSHKMHLFWIQAIDMTTFMPWEICDIFYKSNVAGEDSWSSDRRLSYNNLWYHGMSVAASENFIHLVYPGPTFQNGIFYLRSRDNGTSWDQERTICTLENSDVFQMSECQMAADGRYIHLIFLNNENNANKIYYARSSDEGETWSKPFKLSTPGFNYYMPRLCVDKGHVHLTWRHDSPEGLSSELVYQHSPNGGNRWLPPNNIYTLSPLFALEDLSIGASNGTVHIMSNYFYLRSSDHGDSFEDKNFKANCFSLDGDIIHAIDLPENNAVAYYISPNLGDSWTKLEYIVKPDNLLYLVDPKVQVLNLNQTDNQGASTKHSNFNLVSDKLLSSDQNREIPIDSEQKLPIFAVHVFWTQCPLEENTRRILYSDAEVYYVRGTCEIVKQKSVKRPR